MVNASPIVPCFHRSRLRYRVVSVFDDPEEDIMQFFESTNRYIAKVSVSTVSVWLPNHNCDPLWGLPLERIHPGGERVLL